MLVQARAPLGLLLICHNNNNNTYVWCPVGEALVCCCVVSATACHHVSVLVQYARCTTAIVPAADRIGAWPAWGWPAAALASGACVFGVGVAKARADAAKRAEEAAAAAKAAKVE